NQFRVVERVRQLVRFRHGNLVTPDILTCEERYDFVFCRNVLIYFDQTARERALQTLGRLLAPGGILFVGAAEASLALAAGCTPIDSLGAFAFRFCRADQVRTATMPASQPAGKKTSLYRASPPKSVTVISAPKPQVSESVRPAPNLEAAARLADAGQLEE